jgi:hypothetical protein
VQSNGHSVGKAPTSLEAVPHVEHHFTQLSCGDFVLQKNQMTKDCHKFSPIWEGHFEVVEVTRLGLYRLQWEDDFEVPYSWNDDQL